MLAFGLANSSIDSFIAKDKVRSETADVRSQRRGCADWLSIAYLPELTADNRLRLQLTQEGKHWIARTLAFI